MNIDRINEARAAILDDLQKRLDAKDENVAIPVNTGRFYKPQKNFICGAGEIDCPVCKNGKLKYSRSGYSGHVHAHCTSGICVSWME